MPEAIDVPAGRLFLGGAPETRAEAPLFLKASDLTTHGVIVGMTGSGKTGLGVVLLEEVLLAGLPALVIDPKGDMGNLLLSFPALAGSDFEPWVSEQEAQQQGLDRAAYAASIADVWRGGLAGWGVFPERIARLRETVDFTLYTPGSTAGVPLNILGSLQAPKRSGGVEVMRDEVEGFVSSLLALVGIEGDPISSREHILLASLIEHAWSQGRDLDLARLLGEVLEPPLRRLGVFDIDAFFPKKERRALAMKLNGLLASPAFGTWLEGPALDVGRLLYGEGGRPQAAIVSLAHLSDVERQFVVTLILSKLVTWMRSQPGSDDLRALVYMDEVFGFVPPTQAPPSKKPILTILKQARAFGVGMVLATQNPVDIDYKALSNAGTWMVGRLQTERDKARLLDGLLSAGGGADRRQIESRISGLGKRQFLYHSTKRDGPQVFATRWAMSYLRGPMTRAEIGLLTAQAPGRSVADPLQAAAAASTDGQQVAPETAPGTPVYYLHPAAAGWDALPAQIDRGGTRLEAALAFRMNLLFDDDRADLRHTEEWEAVVYPLSDPFGADDAVAIDYDDRDLVGDPPPGATYVLPEAPLASSAYFKRAASAVKEHLYRTRTVDIFKNRELRLYSRVGETGEAFAERCRQVAEEGEDAAAAQLRERYAKRIGQAQGMLARAQDRLDELEVDQSARRTDELVSGAGSLLTALLGGRRGAKSLAAGLRKASSKRSQTRRSAQRRASAAHKVEDVADRLEALEDELAEALLAIDDEWDDKAAAIEPVAVSLEKTDIAVGEAALVWIPVRA